MSGDVHVRFWESAGAKLPRATHLPLSRPEGILTRHGVYLSRSTLCDWVRDAATVLGPLAELQKALVLQSPVIWTDDTPVTVLGGGQPGSPSGRFSVSIGDDEHPYSAYDFTMSRSRDGPAAFLSDYRGSLQADAYGGYDGIFLGSDGGVVEVACWAHARRKSYGARSSAPTHPCGWPRSSPRSPTCSASRWRICCRAPATAGSTGRAGSGRSA